MYTSDPELGNRVCLGFALQQMLQQFVSCLSVAGQASTSLRLTHVSLLTFEVHRTPRRMADEGLHDLEDDGYEQEDAAQVIPMICFSSYQKDVAHFCSTSPTQGMSFDSFIFRGSD